MASTLKSWVRRLWSSSGHKIIEIEKIKDSLGTPLDKFDVVKIGQDFAVMGDQGIFKEYKDNVVSIKYTMLTGRFAKQSFFATQSEINSCGHITHCAAPVRKMIKVPDYEIGLSQQIAPHHS